MGQDVFTHSAAARAVFEAVDEALDVKLSALIFAGPIEDLTLTANAQPALMATSIAVLRAIEAESGKGIVDFARCVAGHSLGEYTALIAAGVLSLGDGARLLRLRGEAMQRAVAVGEGAMAAVLGLEIAAIERVLDQLGGSDVVEVANDNANGQAVISGGKEAVERALDALKQAGAKRSVLLPVSAPFHCRLMHPAALTMREALATTRFDPPAVPVLTNIDATAKTEPHELREALVEQVTARVRWRETLLTLPEQGVREAVELGAGKALAGMVKRTVPAVTPLSVHSMAEVEAFAATLDAAA